MEKKYTIGFTRSIILILGLAFGIISNVTAQTFDLTTVQPASTDIPVGATFEWHSGVPTASNLITGTAVTEANPGIYYAVYNFGTCYSMPTPFKIVTNACPSSTIDLTAQIDSTGMPSGMTVRYLTSVSPLQLYSGDPKSAAPGEYYVAYYDTVDQCYSNYSPVVFILSSCCLVTTPTNLAITPSPACVGDNITLTADACSPGTLTWYSDQSMLNPISNTLVATASTTYYAACVESTTCFSSALPISLIVNSAAKITAANITSTNPYSCIGIAGTIEICGLTPSISYTLNYTKDGTVATPVNLISNSTGCVTLNNLSGGTYDNFKLIDNTISCSTNTLINPIQLIDHIAPVVNVTSTNPISCLSATGIISIQNLVSGVSYTYSYVKDGGSVITGNFTANGTTHDITSLNAGSYTNINVTNSDGCTSNNSVVNLSDPTAPVIIIGSSTNPSSCGANDGRITISGLTTGSNYVLTFDREGFPSTPIAFTATSTSYDILGLLRGNYTNIKVTTTGCTSNLLNVELVDQSAPNISITSFSRPTTCAGADGSITLSGLIAGQTYTLNYDFNGVDLSPGLTFTASSSTYIISSLSAGVYKNITVTNTNCVSNSVSMEILDPAPNTIISATKADVSACGLNDGSITITGLNPIYTYTIHYLKDGVVQTPINVPAGSTSSILNDLSAGNYTGINAVTSNCVSNSLTEIITSPTGTLIDIAYVNPSTCGGNDGAIYVTGLSQGKSYTISYEKAGDLPVEITISNSTTTSYRISNLSAGSYINIFAIDGTCPSNNKYVVLYDPIVPTAPTIASTISNTCPTSTVDLTSMTGTAPATVSYEWHSTNDILASSLVTTPSAVSIAGTYYLFAKSDQSCWSASQSVLVTIVGCNPGIAIVKTSNVSGTGAVGDRINYTFSIKNTGDVTLTNVTVTDPNATVEGGPIATLAVGATDNSTITGYHVITQVDINAGSYTNQATATGNTPTGTVSDISGTTITNDTPTVTPIAQSPGIAIVKTSTVSGTGAVGDRINYTFSIKNTGNVTLTNVTVTDPNATVEGGPIATLAVGATDNSTITGYHVITQADINAGSYTNQATATGNTPTGTVSDISGTTITNDTPTVTPIAQSPGIAIVKTSTVSGTGAVGDRINYTFSIKNTGDVTLTNVTVTDPNATVEGGPIATLAVGATDNSTITGYHVITQADIDAGSYTNQATATGTTPTNGTVTDISGSTITNDTPTVTPIAQSPGIAIVKTSTVSGIGAVGDRINYTFSIKNTGDVTLTNVTVTDPNATVEGGPIATLAVGATDNTTITGYHTITQADIDAGSYTNQATATGNTPTGTVSDISGTTITNDTPTVTPIAQTPGIAIVKTSTVGGTGAVGDKINYTFSIKNTGNVTLTNVTVTDPNAIVVGGPIATLAIGATDNTTIIAYHVITQSDINAGSYTNQATATGTTPTNGTVSDKSGTTITNDTPTVTPISQTPGIAIIKKSTIGGTGTGLLGEIISYKFIVTNTGNIPLTNVVVTDPNATIIGGALATLAIGMVDSTTFSGTHVITQNDVLAGKFTNQATATGNTPTGTVSDLSDNASNLANNPTITILNGGLSILPQAWLQGALFNIHGASGIMRDDLRSKNLIPLNSPYPVLGFTELTSTGTISPSVLSVVGNNAIVDWVFVELRDANNPTQIVDSRSALIQRDGDIVDLDGTSSLRFSLTTMGNYYVAVRHRNHLGVMTKNPLPLTSTASTIDFRSTLTPVYTISNTIVDQAEVVVDQGVALWAGNDLHDNSVIYQGTNNDVNNIYQQVSNATGNTFATPYFIYRNYNLSDINMDGNVIFQGTGNDVNYIYQNVLNNHIGNTLKVNYFIIKEQLP